MYDRMLGKTVYTVEVKSWRITPVYLDFTRQGTYHATPIKEHFANCFKIREWVIDAYHVTSKGVSYWCGDTELIQFRDTYEEAAAQLEVVLNTVLEELRAVVIDNLEETRR